MKAEKLFQLIKSSNVSGGEDVKKVSCDLFKGRICSKGVDSGSEEELIEVSDMLDDSEVDLSEESVRDMLGELDDMEKEGELDDDMKKVKKVLNVLSELSDKSKIRDSIDIDKDGSISSDEIKEFLKDVAKIDGVKDSVSLIDIVHKVEAMGFKIDDEGNIEVKGEKGVEEGEEGEKEVKEVKEEDRVNLGEIVLDDDLNSVQDSVPFQGVGNAGYSAGVGGGGGNYGLSGVSGYGGSGLSSGISDTKSLEDQKAEIEGEINTKKGELSSVRSGEHSEVKAAMDEEEKAKEAMDKAIEEDDKVSKELKEKLDSKIDEIDKKEDEIDKKNSEIDEVNNSISECEGSVSNLEASLSSLPAPSGKEEDKERDAKIRERKSELENEIKEKKSELEELKSKLKTLEEELKGLEGELDKLNEEKKEIEDEIKENCSEETKNAIDNYEKAKQNTEDVKSKLVESIQGEIDNLQVKLNEVNRKIEEKKDREAASEFNFDFDENMTENQKSALEQFKNIFESNKEKYKAVEAKTGVPAELIAAIHWRESGGNFNTYLHNGDPLGSPTTHVPVGKYFTNWEDAAIDALSGSSYGSVEKDNIQSYYDYAERYNGLGYRNKGVASPYVWAGTSNYSSGKYVRDGVYDPNTKDQQLGVAIMLKSLLS